jgi:DNA-binding CsgD family transcriptional regulator
MDRHPTPHPLTGFFEQSLLPKQTEPHAPLSDREREVLARVAMGETGETIADALHISSATVETHVRHCLAKLGAKNRPHAIALGLQRGEIGLTGGAGAASTVDRRGR